MTDTAKADETAGRVQQEDKAAVGAGNDSKYYQDEIKNLKSANDTLRTGNKKEVDDAKTALAQANVDAATQKEETDGLRAAADTRAAEDKAELAELVTGMEESAQKAVNALPDTMSDRAKLLFVKGNKDLLLSTKQKVQVFSQETKGGAAAGTDFKLASLGDLKGRKAIAAEKQRLKEKFGG